MANIKSPICKAYWTHNCFESDKKYPDRSGQGVFSITGNFTQENRDELEKLILSEIGESHVGTYHFKSDGTGNTDVKFKCKESVTGRNGVKVLQRPPVVFEGKVYEESFEHADCHVLFTPKYFPAYKKCSLILRGVEIVKLADATEQSAEEHDIAILKELGAMNGDT